MLTVNWLTALHNLGYLVSPLRCVWLALRLRGRADVLVVLTLVRLRLR